ncbi:MAG: hypothetical protein JWM36_4152 [Hyphomicrobiales bacterium]|nr:hypothetical protein [Hyphomicrobiales bacterium]
MAQLTLDTDYDRRFLLDPYLEWTKGEGIPTYEDFGIDILAVETARWDRFDARGAFIHAKGRGDFCATFALELVPGGRTSPQKHLFEEVVYVLEGHGSTTIEAADGRKHSFEWGPKSLFALPLNTRYQHFNASGRDRALLASTHDMPVVMNLFHNADFIFANDYVFAERMGPDKHSSGDGDFTSIRPGSHLWETNFVPDLTNFELKAWEARGAGSSNIAFVLADGTMHTHMSEIPAGRYKKGHRHGDGMHVFAVTGTGYSLFWHEGEQEFRNVPWRHGVMYAPPHLMFHQHFNTAAQPARYIAVGIGSRRYPFIRMRREAVLGSEVNVKEGGMQIDYVEQDARIHVIWLEEMRKAGMQSDMGKYIDEAAAPAR